MFQLEEVSQQHDRLEKQAMSVQSRLKNLQRKTERSERKVGTELQLDMEPIKKMQLLPKVENKPKAAKVFFILRISRNLFRN